MGNIDEEQVRPIVEQYLASLPGQPEKGDFTKVPMDFVEGSATNVFQRAMENPKASVFNVVGGKIERSLENQIRMTMLDQILDIVYTEKVREEEGGTYGVYRRQ